ncbi:hypothetical protein MHH33_13850 [Paenisporosarcina sp. FSL H8-0542]|uniref:hypothetical protein n=1 Tax=Paenisporosarcina sp. FSL H8-0542 TaxID=2921401 RepID=UPI003159BCC0
MASVYLEIKVSYLKFTKTVQFKRAEMVPFAPQMARCCGFIAGIMDSRVDIEDSTCDIYISIGDISHWTVFI